MRKKAVHILNEVLQKKKKLSTLLQNHTFEGIQRNWLQEICSGVLRWKGRIDFILDQVTVRKKTTGWMRRMLEMTIYQLIAQDRISSSQVVYETVEMIRAQFGQSSAHFANACLRKISLQQEMWKKWEFPCQASLQEQAAWASLPLWLWKKISTEYHLSWAKEYALASLERPKFWLCTWDANKIKKASLITHFQPQLFSQKAFVQDISIQILIDEVHKILKSQVKQVLDLCAAPGGKSMGLSLNEFQVLATDIHPQRYAQLKENIHFYTPAVKVFDWKELDALPPQELVWVDAPCSGSGILRKHPEIRWIRSQKEISELIVVQKALIELGWQKTRLGGYLLYSVCSILHEEGLEHFQALGLKVKKTWLFAPHLKEKGDGFWAILVQKEKETLIQKA